MKKIAIIPARSGSKGLPNKNVLLANGKPLIAYTIEAALESEQFELIIVTTDSLEYKEAISNYPVEIVIRDESLSNDNASSYVVIEDILKRNFGIGYDYFVLLQPTSPLRTSQHIRESIDKFEKNIEKFDFLVSMTKAEKSSYLLRNIGEDESLSEYNSVYSNYSRQKYNEYCPNGAIYIAKPQKYINKKDFYGQHSLAYFMAKEESIDIDDAFDFEVFLFLLEKRNKKEKLKNKIRDRIKNKNIDSTEYKDITLVGHSIFDMWGINSIKNKSVHNMGISGINTRDYIDYVVDKDIIKKYGEYVFLLSGTNDIIDESVSNREIASEIQELVDKIKNKSPKSKLYFIEIPLTAFRKDRENYRINQLNNMLRKNLFGVGFLSLDKLRDKYGKLDLNYTYDGLHLNEKGYEILDNIISEVL